MKLDMANIKFDEHGLVPAIVQDAKTFEVLTLAYMNAESIIRTIATNETWFWSRSRSSLWHKGETSGNKQHVIDVSVDCDHDAIRVLVLPEGPACHTGAQSCFHNELQNAPVSDNRKDHVDFGDVIGNLYSLVQSRKRERPAGSYSTYLFDQGLDKILKKVGEESAETIIAAKNEDPGALVSETADLLYHLIVLLVQRGVSLGEVRDELVSRSSK